MELKIGQEYTAIAPDDQTQFTFKVESHEVEFETYVCQPEFPEDSGYENLPLSLGQDDVEDWQIKPVKS